MIRRLLSIILLLAIGGALTYFGLSYHYVNTDDKLLMVRKSEMGFTDTYADIREWTLSDYREHPQLVEALIEEGHADVIPAQLTDRLRDALEGLFRNEAAPPAETSTGTDTGPH